MSTEWTGNGADRPVAPRVLATQHAGGLTSPANAVAYVPSQRLRRGDTEATLELRNTEDGLVAMLAFTSLEQLVECCGPAQPWVAVPMDGVENLQELSGADVIFWDVELPSDERYPTGKGRS